MAAAAVPRAPVVLPEDDRSGEVLSFDAIYERSFDFVWRNVRRLGVADALVDDAVQEVFLVVHRRLDEYAGRGTIESWIFGIVLRVASDVRRAMRRKSPHLRDKSATPIDPDSLADDRASSPDEKMARVEGAA